MSSQKTGKEGTEDTWSCWLRTMLAGSGSLILMVFVGINEAQSSVMLPQLKREDSFIHVTPDQESWIASLGIIMAPITSITIGPFLDVFGRKKGLQLFYLISAFGYGVMYCAREVYHIYIGRIICGAGAGLYVCSVVYLVEICTKKQRECIFAVTSAILSLGITIASIVGGYLPWYTASLIFSLTAFVFFILQCFIPESPPWLFKKGKEDALIGSLRKLGRSESAIRRELVTFKQSYNDNKRKVDFRTFLSPTVWKPFVIMITFYFLQSSSGIFDLLHYTVDVVERLGTTYNPISITVMLSTTRLLAGTTIAIIFRTKFGRKFSTAFSGFWAATALIGVGIYVYVQRDVSIEDKTFQWLPVALLNLYVVASVLGLLGLPWLMTSEVYPLNVRGTMTGATFLVAYAFVFISVKTYYVCVEALQIYGLVLVFAGASLVAVFFGLYVLPETQNKTLFDIEQGFLPKKKRQLEMSVTQNGTVTMGTVLDQVER